MSSLLDQSALTALAERLVSAAKAAGADAADAVAVRGVSLAVEVREGAVEESTRSEGDDVGLRVFVGRRQASVSGSDISARLTVVSPDLVEAQPEMNAATPKVMSGQTLRRLIKVFMKNPEGWLVLEQPDCVEPGNGCRARKLFAPRRITFWRPRPRRESVS